MSKDVYSIRVEDQEYSGESEVYLLQARSCADAEKKSLAMFRQKDAERIGREPRRKPFVRKIELIGSLNN